MNYPSRDPHKLLLQLEDMRDDAGREERVARSDVFKDNVRFYKATGRCEGLDDAIRCVRAWIDGVADPQ